MFWNDTSHSAKLIIKYTIKDDSICIYDLDFHMLVEMKQMAEARCNQSND